MDQPRTPVSGLRERSSALAAGQAAPFDLVRRTAHNPMKPFTHVLALLGVLGGTARATDRPNIVLIYADDLGDGDVSCYGAGRVRTPAVNRLAREGLRFTDGHALAATCTPARAGHARPPGPHPPPGPQPAVSAPTCP
jgi:hypothetical protein